MDQTSEIVESLENPWEAFIDATADLRHELFGFGLRLTRNPFDGEDLVQEALLRAFGAAAFQDGGVGNLRAYLFRTMANLWIDEQRRTRDTLRAAFDDVVDESSNHADSTMVLRDVAATVFDELAPRERAAIVLHDGLGFRHAEIADLLSTTEGAVRSALHRAKSRLAAEDPPARAATSRADRSVVDRFIAAFSAGDVLALRDLLVDDVEAAVFPAGVGRGADWAIDQGWIRGCLYHHHRDYEATGQPYPTTVEADLIAGEPIVLASREGEDGIKLEEVWRFETDDGRIERVRDYGFCPDLVAWVGTEIGRPTRAVGYRFGVHPTWIPETDEQTSRSANDRLR